ncbi:hypothetical protein BC830DRAFT_1087412 [Chytriomyces sp. MP71]|nr:hypothetical protein BC830DRAFT_1087412 [Chytriomyces sp. MP71]
MSHTALPQLVASPMRPVPEESGSRPTGSASPMLGVKPGDVTRLKERRLTLEGYPQVELPLHIINKYNAFYVRFICEGSHYQVNISAPVRLALQSKYKTGKWTIEDLEAAKEEVVQSMYLNLYPRWVAERQARPTKK